MPRTREEHMTYKKDTKLTFDVSGNLASDGQVAVGCQMVPLTDLAGVAASLSVIHGAVRATGIVGTADGERNVSFEGSTRTFSESQIHDVARNLQAEEPEPVVPPSEWQDGDAVFIEDYGTIVRNEAGQWLRSSGSQWHDGDDWFDWWNAARVTVLVKGGKLHTETAPDPSTLSWQDGDKIRLERTGDVRERVNGRWRNNATRAFTDWHDREYDEALARGGERWTVLRKGGVDLAA
jgi:hypothetical protein